MNQVAGYDGQEFLPRSIHISIINELLKYRGNPLRIKISSDLFSAAGLGPLQHSQMLCAALSFHMNHIDHIDTRLANMLIQRKLMRKEAELVQQYCYKFIGRLCCCLGTHVPGTKHIFDTELLTPKD